MEQLQLFSTSDGPYRDYMFMCDMCKNLILRDDGYCCCIAPKGDGRGFVGRKHRRKVGSKECDCYEYLYL